MAYLYFYYRTLNFFVNIFRKHKALAKNYLLRHYKRKR